MNNKIRTGIEIECVINTKIHDFKTGDYHKGIKIEGLKGWKAEKDGSLSTHNEFEGWEKTVEIVSRIFKTQKALEKGLKNFQTYFSKNNQYELKEVLNFNQTCGSHIHISIPNFSFNQKTIFEIFPKIREVFIKKIRESNIKNKEDIIKHYNRHYARKITKTDWKEGRYEEFNFQSEQEKKGLEWRSINLFKIETWEEFFELWKITYKTIKLLNKSAQKYQHTIEHPLKEEIELTQRESQRYNFNRSQPIYVPQRNKTKTYQSIKIKEEKITGQNINLNTNTIQEGEEICVI